MWQYTRHTYEHNGIAGPKLINAPGNGVLLRADMHQLYDQSYFTFIVKDGAVYYHFFRISAADIAELYHNTSVKIPVGVPAEQVYARFAWTVINQVSYDTGSIPTLPSPISVRGGNVEKEAWKRASRDPRASTLDSDGIVSTELA